MGEVGDLLRQSREQLGLSLEDVAASTRINIVYLEALENEDFEAFPHPTVSRGFLRTYSKALNLDADYVLDTLDGNSQPSRRGRRRGGPLSEDGIRMKSISMSAPARMSTDLLVGLLLIAVLVLVALGVFYVYQDMLTSLETASVGAPKTPTSPAAFVLPTPTLAPTLTPSPTVTPTPLYYAGVTVELQISDASWVQVLVDGRKDYEGILKPGETKHWSGDRQVAVRVGNAGGVEAIINGESAGLMGEPGQVVDRIFVMKDDGVAVSYTPTPTAAAEAAQ